MSLHAAAKHLASKGRNGDTTLVHMTKGEVAGLQALARKQGTSLTINPHTGLPEAFSLKSLLPMAAGAAMTYFSGGAINPMMAAGIMGLGTTAATGSLSKGMMAGLGAYGGAGLGAGLGAMGTEAGTTAAAGEAEAAAAAAAETEAAKQTALQTAGQEAVTPQAIEQVAGEQATRNAVGNQAVWEQSARDYASNAAGNANELVYAQPGQATIAPANTGFTASTQQTLAQPPMQSGLEAAYKNPGAYVDKLGGGMQTAKLAGMAAAPVIADALAPKPYTQPEIKGDSDMGQRYAFESGYDNSIPGRAGPASYRQISNEEAKKLYGFADGGDVQYPYGESVVRMAEGGTSALAATPSYDAVTYGMSGGNGFQAAPAASGYNPTTGYSAAQTAAMNAAPTKQATPNQRIIDLYKAADAKRAAEEAAELSGNGYTIGKKGMFGAETSGSDVVGVRADGTPVYGEFSTDANGLYGPGSRQYDTYMAQQRASSANQYAAKGGVMHSYAQGGISTLGGYSDGGRLLRGPGDGVSDSIPAVIGHKQPARLADGEFVVPARIVSEIGNGSTEAGARKLYAMMDRVQKARGKTVGKGKVAKNTRADKFLPA